MPIEFHDRTTVEVPAGRFDAVHATLAGANQMWVTADDYIVLRMRLPRLNAEYVLTCLATGTGVVTDGRSPCSPGSP